MNAAPIVGIGYHPPAAEVLSHIGYDEPLQLRREPTNEFDENAISVWWRVREPVWSDLEISGTFLERDSYVMLGYIPRAEAAKQAPIFDKRGSCPPALLAFSAAGKPFVTWEVEDA